MAEFEVLKKRKDFLRVAKGIKVVASTIILQAARSLCVEESLPKVGFTVTKKVGKANVRNRAKRRLRAAVREVFAKFAMENVEYVLIGRHNTATEDFAILLRDLEYGLKRVCKEISNDE